MLIQKISTKIGQTLGEALNLNQDKKEIISYGAFNLIQTLLSILWVVIIGIVFNVLYEALIVSFSISILRKYSGGVHATSSNRCILIGTFVTVCIALFTDKVFGMLKLYIIFLLCILCLAISYGVIYKYAPVDSPAKPIVKPETKKRLRKNSFYVLNMYIVIISILFIIYFKYINIVLLKFIGCICLGMVWQVFTLTNLGHKVLSNIDNRLKNIF